MTTSDDRWPALLLAFIGGYVDTFSFVVLAGLFTAHVTGNFVLVGAAVAGQGHAGVVTKLFALPVFVLAVAVAHALHRRRERRGLASARALVLLQLVLLLAFLALGLVAEPVADVDAPLAVLTGLVGVAAMATQNAAARTAFASASPTTVMTGNVTQATMDLIDLLLVRPAEPAAVARIAKMAPPIAAFAAGALCAGLLAVHLAFACLLVPVALLALLLRRL